MYFITIAQPYRNQPFNLGTDGGHLITHQQYIALTNLGLQCAEQASNIDNIVFLRCANRLSSSRTYPQNPLHPPILEADNYWFVEDIKMQIHVKNWHTRQDPTPYIALVNKYLKCSDTITLMYNSSSSSPAATGFVVELGLFRSDQETHRSIGGIDGPWHVSGSYGYSGDRYIEIDNISVAVRGDTRITVLVDTLVNERGLQLLEMIFKQYVIGEHDLSVRRLKDTYHQRIDHHTININDIDHKIQQLYIELGKLHQAKMQRMVSANACKRIDKIQNLVTANRVCNWTFTDRLRVRVGPLMATTRDGIKYSLGHFTIIINDLFSVAIVGEQKIIIDNNYYWTPTTIVPRNPAHGFVPAWDAATTQAFADLISEGDYTTAIDLIVQWIEDCGNVPTIAKWPIWAEVPMPVIPNLIVPDVPYNGYFTSWALTKFLVDAGMSISMATCACATCQNTKASMARVLDVKSPGHKEWLSKLMRYLPPNTDNLTPFEALKKLLSWMGLSVFKLDKWFNYVQPEPLKEGYIVKRGPDWKWANQDDNSFGIVTGPHAGESGWYCVMWNNGHKARYRWGAEESIDLVIVAKEPTGEFAELAARAASVTPVASKAPSMSTQVIRPQVFRGTPISADVAVDAGDDY